MLLGLWLGGFWTGGGLVCEGVLPLVRLEALCRWPWLMFVLVLGRSMALCWSCWCL